MPRRSVTPSLADIRQDLVGSIPVDLITAWVESEGSDTVHARLLEPYKVSGTVVCSDSSGLSKLTSERPLLEVMQLISQPKEVIYSYGKKLGGQPVGLWVADNTQMLYPARISPQEVVIQMIGAQKEIKTLPVQVGMTVSCGEFIEIGGALYGKHADLIEEIAESKAKGGEVIICEQTKSTCPLEWSNALVPRKDLANNSSFFLLQHELLGVNADKTTDYNYPHPFDQEFFEMLRNFQPTKAEHYENDLRRYTYQRIVILVKVNLPKDLLLLDQLTNWAACSAIMRRVAQMEGINQVKSNGSIGIYLTDSVECAFELSFTICAAIAELGFKASVGLAAGDVLLFPMQLGAEEIAGGPVNIASKLAEDVAEPGSIYIHETVILPKKIANLCNPFTHSVSGMKLKGMRVSST